LSFSVGYSTCPPCQDNLLQYRRPNLYLGISIPYSVSTDVQICHTGPTLISLASDKRKAPSLVAPLASKKKRTTKKRLIQVRILSSLSIKPLFILTIFILCNFRPELSNHLSLQILPMLHPLVKFFTILLFLIIFLFIGTYPLLTSCKGNFGEPNHGEFFSST
jgi:hypothetical protein